MPRQAAERTARAERRKILESGLPLGAGAKPLDRGGETKARILDSAIDIFGDRGFEACTMRELAGEVGIKAPAIYNHYGSKEEVLAAVMEHILGFFFWTVLTPLEEAPIDEWLERLVKADVGFQLNNRRLARANGALLSASNKKRVLPPAVYRRIVAAERGYIALLDALVRLEAPGGDRWESMMAGFAISAMCNQTVTWYDPAGRLSVDQVAERSWRLVEQMIAAQRTR